jgi:hypothetical protein
MKKRSIWILLVVLAIILAGCTQAEPEQEPEWIVTIVTTNGSEIEFTDLDVADLDPIVVETIRTKKDGTVLEESWTGVTLKSVFEAKQITGYTGCSAEAADGYAVEYTAEVMDGDETIIAWLLDGVAMDEENGGPVQLVPKGQSANMYLKGLSKIILK